MKLLYKKENIGNWRMFSNKCYINQNNFVLELENNKPIIQLIDYWGINFNETFFNVYSSKSSNTFYNYEGSFLRIYEKANFYYFNSENEFIFYDRVEKKSFYHNEFICDGKILNLFSYKTVNLFFVNENKLSLHTRHKGIIWQFPLSQLSTFTTDEDEEKPAELISIIGVHNTILWLLVTDRRLIALDTETGTLLHEINLCEALGIKPQTVENYSFSLGDTHLNVEKEKIKGFAHRYYWELDLNSLQAEIKVDFGQGNTWRIKKSKYYQEDKILYFTGARSGETFDRAIGIFDTEKCQIIWYDEPLDEGRYLFFTDIQANDKLIGALDSEQNLRIYEKE